MWLDDSLEIFQSYGYRRYFNDIPVSDDLYGIQRGQFNYLIVSLTFNDIS